jgi:hypothetical protein
MPVVNLMAVILVVLAIVGLCWYLLSTLSIDPRIKNIVNVLIVLGLVLWLLLWLLPRLAALAV